VIFRFEARITVDENRLNAHVPAEEARGTRQTDPRKRNSSLCLKRTPHQPSAN
jgi:hypothetical protein